MKKPTAAKAKPAATKQTTLKVAKSAPAPKAKKRAKHDSDEENSDIDSDSLNDASLLSNTPPAKKPKPAPTRAPKMAGKPLAEVENESFHFDGDAIPTKPLSAKEKKSTEQYQKLTQLEHILKRPDTYIGSVERTTEQLWVYNSTTEVMENRKVSYVPGLYKIFDEILVNAADNKQRDKNMNELKVWVDAEKGVIAVRNNGRGIPIEVHDKEGIYIPEMIFGHLLTSSNYDDEEAKVTGGRNGYGAKLTNIYSTQFDLETVDSKQKKKYRQTWRNNMSVMDKAKIDASKDDDYTKITFKPDFRKFGMDKMDEDFEALVKRRVYDMAGTAAGVKVYLNGDRIKISKFKQYMEMYTKAIKTENLQNDGKTSEQVILTDNPHERWEVGFAVSDGSFQQVSFVNSIATMSGGTHVNYIADQICDKLEEIVKKKNKGGVTLKKAQIRNHIFLFVNCLVVNPAFTSQTKEQLTTKPSQFGSKPQVSEKFLKDIAKTEAVNNIIHFAQQKADKVLAKSDGNRRQRMNNSKLTDANLAGTKDGYKCTLILTEGDSASLLALAGRAVVNPDRFGVFPLRGKILNVRDASIEQISKNQEIQNIKKFMGLQHKKDYTDTRSLRYGHLMIMTDQDHDGSHIKGLLINFLQVQYPSLLKLDGFLMEFITPIVKVWKGDPKNPRSKRDFFTMPEYEAWKLEPGHEKGWDHKYFKGLGTSDTTDAEIYFADLDKHLKEFHKIRDGESDLIDLAFSKKKADARKVWLQNFVPGTYLDMSGTEKITYDDFINKELILFSMADNMRSIPSVIDGFKPGQRKVLYTCFRRNLKKDVKVVELAGSVSGLTAYSYGETSLQQTIVGLAQNFVGSNNINCLEPSGNFGSRLQGGQDAASARYIYTRLSPFARRLFQQSDEPLLTYNTDDGKTIEPEMYMPIIPMILINGADGIGTGWSTSIPNYKPEDVIANLKRRMAGDSKENMLPMMPWFRGFRGEVEKLDENGDRFKSNGIISETGDNEVEITELPVRVWTQDFKDRLEEIIRAEKVPSFIKDYTEYNTPAKVHFIIKMEEKKMKESLDKLEEVFKLTKSIATSNMVAFDAQGRIHRYATPLDIMEEFYQVRLRMYQRRKAHLLNEMQRELEKLSNQARFIRMIIDGKLTVSKKKKAVLVAELQKLDFKRFPKVADAKKEGEFEAVVEEEQDEPDDAETVAGASDYDYLLGMAIWSLTQERVEKLNRQIGDKQTEIDVLIRKSEKDLWNEDLDALSEEWQNQLDEEVKRDKKVKAKGRRASAKLGIGGSKSKKRKAGDSDASDDDFEVKRPKVTATSKLKAGLGLLGKPESKPAGTYELVNGVEQKPMVKPVAPVDLDAAVAAARSGTLAAAKAGVTKKPAVVTKPAVKKKRVLSDDEDGSNEDAFLAIAKEAPSLPASKASSMPAARTGRAAAQKTKKYTDGLDSDESVDSENDKIGDLGLMVKGVGSKPEEGSTRIFHNTPSASRPSSSHGMRVKPRITEIEISDDESNWGALVQGSPRKIGHRTALSDDDDDLLLSDKPSKPITKPVAKAKPIQLPKPKEPAALKPKKASSVAPSIPKPLSPAAKAYASKQAKAGAQDKPSVPKPAASKLKRKTFDSDDESEADKMANELFSDDNDSPVKPAAARPARRAAAAPKAKSKYVDDDDEEDEDDASSEMDFDDEDSD